MFDESLQEAIAKRSPEDRIRLIVGLVGLVTIPSNLNDVLNHMEAMVHDEIGLLRGHVEEQQYAIDFLRSITFEPHELN